jgi:hypothetical protein
MNGNLDTSNLGDKLERVVSRYTKMVGDSPQTFEYPTLRNLQKILTRYVHYTTLRPDELNFVKKTDKDNRLGVFNE